MDGTPAAGAARVATHIPRTATTFIMVSFAMALETRCKPCTQIDVFIMSYWYCARLGMCPTVESVCVITQCEPQLSTSWSSTQGAIAQILVLYSFDSL